MSARLSKALLGVDAVSIPTEQLRLYVTLDCRALRAELREELRRRAGASGDPQGELQAMLEVLDDLDKAGGA